MDDFEIAELRADMLQILLLMPAEDRLRFVLYYYCELTQEEIALLEGCTHQTVSRRLKRTCDLLKPLTGAASAKQVSL